MRKKKEIEWIEVDYIGPNEEIQGTKCHQCISHKSNKNGYIHLSRNNNQIYLHRYIWSERNGPIPEGLLVRHKCDNKQCINIEHLEIGTYYDNNHDTIKRGRMPAYDRTNIKAHQNQIQKPFYYKDELFNNRQMCRRKYFPELNYRQYHKYMKNNPEFFIFINYKK